MLSSLVTVRKVLEQDRQSLANLIQYEMHVHRHLDWRPPLDWIGTQPYLVGEISGDIHSVLVCPPDPPEAAWIRLFAASGALNTNQAWHALWQVAQAALAALCQPQVAAIPTETWFSKILTESGFEPTDNIISLLWQADQPLPAPRPTHIRPMTSDDLPAVFELDVAAFESLWRNSFASLRAAYHQSALATLIEEEGQLVGYQISTAGPLGGHLARLAVRPGNRTCGIGYALVHDLLDYFSRRGVEHITVNTQEDNLASLKLYQKAGFRPSGEVLPVYQRN
jgi:ribosomal-protein-alanine N-acetyltransferase